MKNGGIYDENVFCGHTFSAIIDEVDIEKMKSTFDAPPEHYCPNCQFSLENVNG